MDLQADAVPQPVAKVLPMSRVRDDRASGGIDVAGGNSGADGTNRRLLGSQHDGVNLGQTGAGRFGKCFFMGVQNACQVTLVLPWANSTPIDQEQPRLADRFAWADSAARRLVRRRR